MLPCWYPGARLFWLCDCCFLERILAVNKLLYAAPKTSKNLDENLSTKSNRSAPLYSPKNIVTPTTVGERDGEKLLLLVLVHSPTMEIMRTYLTC